MECLHCPDAFEDCLAYLFIYFGSLFKFCNLWIIFYYFLAPMAHGWPWATNTALLTVRLADQTGGNRNLRWKPDLTQDLAKDLVRLNEQIT